MLDKPRLGRHHLHEVARALWFLAVLTAFVVAGARCLSLWGAPARETVQGVALSQASHTTSQQEPEAGLTADDDADDGADALLAPSLASLELPQLPRPLAGKVSVACEQRALKSHASGLDRPPRA